MTGVWQGLGLRECRRDVNDVLYDPLQGFPNRARSGFWLLDTEDMLAVVWWREPPILLIGVEYIEGFRLWFRYASMSRCVF